MKSVSGIGLSDVQAVYSGPEGDLWELLMGQQIHIGGFRSSMELAERASIGEGMSGVDLCCCNGAGMRMLIRFRNVARMTGVDATPTVVERGRRRCEEEGLADRISLLVGDACNTDLDDGSADFVWGEDAWCYVEDKDRLVAEAVRLVRPNGVIAFTDWVEGPAGMSTEEAHRLLKFMKFPNIQDLSGYAGMLSDCGCEMLTCEDTGRFPRYLELYMNMLEMQLTYDGLRAIGFDTALMESLGHEMAFMRDLANNEKIAQGIVIARREK